MAQYGNGAHNSNPMLDTGLNLIYLEKTVILVMQKHGAIDVDPDYTF